MPLNAYFAGHGKKVYAEMIRRYGEKKGRQVFYATENARKKRVRRKG